MTVQALGCIPAYYPIRICLANEGGVILSAYTQGHHWNGWEVPCFTKEVADKITGDGLILQFCEKYDMFVFDMGEGDPQDRYEFYRGHDITVDGQTLHVYPVGAGSWCWKDVDHVQGESNTQAGIASVETEVSCAHCGRVYPNKEWVSDGGICPSDDCLSKGAGEAAQADCAVNGTPASPLALQRLKEALYLAQSAHGKNMEGMNGADRDHYSDAERKAAKVYDDILARDVLRIEAAAARLTGEYDNAALVRFGALQIDTAADVFRFLTVEHFG